MRSLLNILLSSNTNPTIALTTKTLDGSGTGTFTSSLTGLTPNTTYYVRAYATNSVGTAYGNEVSFTTYQANAIADYDGNYYNIVTIGTQTWMAENLKTTRYRNGDAIENITDNTVWAVINIGAWCDYLNSASNGTKYGHLYNWYAASDSRYIAPMGWHIPTDAEWTILTTYLGGYSAAGGQLKELGTVNWATPNTGATNLYGFSALPGGSRGSSGSFGTLNNNRGNWWTSTEYSSNYLSYGWYRSIYFDSYACGGGNYDKQGGFSLRCVKD